MYSCLHTVRGLAVKRNSSGTQAYMAKKFGGGQQANDVSINYPSHEFKFPIPLLISAKIARILVYCDKNLLIGNFSRFKDSGRGRYSCPLCLHQLSFQRRVTWSCAMVRKLTMTSWYALVLRSRGQKNQIAWEKAELFTYSNISLNLIVNVKVNKKPERRRSPASLGSYPRVQAQFIQCGLVEAGFSLRELLQFETVIEIMEETHIGLVGESGSGKSSFINALLRYVFMLNQLMSMSCADIFLLVTFFCSYTI